MLSNDTNEEIADDSNSETSTTETTVPTTTELDIKSIHFTCGENFNVGLKETAAIYIKNQNNEIIKDNVTYSIDNKNIATVDDNGNITGNKIGNTTITATTENGKSATCKITVKNAPSSIKLNVTSASIGIEEKSIQLKPTMTDGYSRTKKYTSTSTNIATVDKNGVVTGISEGTATITCTTYNGKKATCKIVVGKSPESIKITNSNNIIQKDSNNHKVTYSLSKGAYSYKITYSIKDTKIATVNSSGYITGKKCGKTTLTIKTYNGKTATQQITVNNDSISLNVNSTQLALDNKNVQKVKYGKSAQNRNLEAFVITNSTSTTLSQTCKIKADNSVNVRSGPGTSYSIVSSLKNGTTVTRIAKAVKKSDGYTWDKIVLSNNKTGYVATNYLVLVKDNTPAQKTIFIDFAIHGFEDEYYRDGQVLVKEANNLIEYFSNHLSELKNYKLIIVPCANPDGTFAGTNNQRACSTAFGRCTSKHIDMNRDWGSFKAVETRNLRDYITKVKPNFYLNMHGWLNETLGDSNLNSLVNKQLGLSKKINSYPSQNGYAISWVHKNLKIPATLVEYKSSDKVSTTKDVSMIKSIINSNGIASRSTTQKYPKAVDWKNGSTSETVYKVSNLTEKIDSLGAKKAAKCYKKVGNSYLIVYEFGKNKKHKAGFVKYAGGVKNAPTESKTYKNGSKSQTVYADTSKKTKVGSLDPKESCKCLGKIDNMYLVVYTVNGTSKQKCGFVTDSGGC
jgi:uncharacterized protein YjdB